MLVSSQYASLVTHTKVGAGVQGSTDWNQIDRCFDPVLVLDPEWGYCNGLGARAWFRVLNGGRAWRDPGAWAQYCVNKMAQVYPYGTRKLIFINEPNLQGEGGGDAISDYQFLGWWGATFVPAIRSLLASRNMADVQLCGPALSPGHQESDGFGGYRYMVDFLRGLDVIVLHHYWYRGGGFLTDDDSQYFAGRVDMDIDFIRNLGIEKPYAIGEYNRPVDLTSSADIANYLSQLKQYNQWLNGYREIVAQFIFLAYNSDSSFDALSLEHMPGSFDSLATFDRFSGEGTATQGQAYSARLEQLLSVNPAFYSQMLDWQAARRQNGEDPQVWLAFREHLAGIYAPDPGDTPPSEWGAVNAPAPKEPLMSPRLRQIMYG